MCIETQLRARSLDRSSQWESEKAVQRVEKFLTVRDCSEPEERQTLTKDSKRRTSVAGCMSLIARSLDAIRMEHYQLCALIVVTCFTSKQLFHLLTRSSHGHGSDVTADSNSAAGVANGMLHLGSFGANFGAQTWVTFVAGGDK
ncbi:hypothetical protein ElyMa_001433600 [Elysia marginata]|uniref:Uncharacterized protein n=1 Tax=Elysia marginata TaxID=1093978 RepID=A0AAV4IXE5_9GAST|nr:hypothetical protein ElyMa_001433600 [Elysia marginata]